MFKGFNNLVVFSSAISLDWFYNFNCCLLISIIFFVFLNYFFLLSSVYFFKLDLSYSDLEFLGCLIPFIFLLIQAIPSLILLFNLNSLDFYSDLTIKVIGHQWYWSYEIGDGLGLEFDSYMKGEDYFILGDKRLLDVDNRLILPVNIFIRFIITSADVIHSWALPNFFLKVDAVSGMLSVINFKFKIIGVFYGQCSEICGANHSFMPIVVEVTLFDFFKNWLMLL